MKQILATILLCCYVGMPSHLKGVSLVYNFRIAQLTKQPIFPQPHATTHSFVILPFDLIFKKNAGPLQNYGGALASYIFDTQHFYARIDCAGAHIYAADNKMTTYSGSASDDILLTSGYSIKFNKQEDILTASALLGIPTHDIKILKHPDFGHGQAGMGLQLDGSYTIDHISSFIAGVRYIHFFSRNAYDNAKRRYRFSIGNMADILCAFKSNLQHHGFELGYTARFDFGAQCTPLFDNILKRTNFTRSSFYAVYKYKFIVHDIAHRFLLNIGYGFDHNPNYFNNKYILTLWGSWQVNF